MAGVPKVRGGLPGPALERQPDPGGNGAAGKITEGEALASLRVQLFPDSHHSSRRSNLGSR